MGKLKRLSRKEIIILISILFLLICLPVIIYLTQQSQEIRQQAEGKQTQIVTTNQDLPDDLQGSQVKIMYVLPSDGTDEKLAENGSLTRSINAFQKFLYDQTGKKVKVDTYNGAYDIGFVRLDQTNNEIIQKNQFVREHIESELQKKGLISSEKIYLVYYGGGSNYSCGSGFRPPRIYGSVVTLHLNAAPDNFQIPCYVNKIGVSDTQPGYFEYIALHEIFHGLGAVPECAPNHVFDGHSGDSNNDIMYAGDLPYYPSRIDVNRDDYWGHGNPNCLDISTSSFFYTPAAPTPTPAPPPTTKITGPTTTRVNIPLPENTFKGEFNATTPISDISIYVFRNSFDWECPSPNIKIDITDGSKYNGRYCFINKTPQGLGTNSVTATNNEWVFRQPGVYTVGADARTASSQCTSNPAGPQEGINSDCGQNSRITLNVSSQQDNPTPPLPSPTPKPIIVTCIPTPSSTLVNNYVTWKIDYLTGGNGTYNFKWTGDEGLDKNTGSVALVNHQYKSPGIKIAKVTVTSGNLTESVECSPATIISALPTNTSPSPTPTNSSFHAADVNHSGCVNVLDYNLWLSAFKRISTPNTHPDIDNDGEITIIDFNQWLIAFKKEPTCTDK